MLQKFNHMISPVSSMDYFLNAHSNGDILLGPK